MTNPRPKSTHPILSGRIPPAGSFVSKLEAYCKYCNQRVEVGEGLTYKVVGRFSDRWVTQHALHCPPSLRLTSNDADPRRSSSNDADPRAIDDYYESDYYDILEHP